MTFICSDVEGSKAVPAKLTICHYRVGKRFVVFNNMFTIPFMTSTVSEEEGSIAFPTRLIICRYCVGKGFIVF